jgi:hypothetical protein
MAVCLLRGDSTLHLLTIHQSDLIMSVPSPVLLLWSWVKTKWNTTQRKGGMYYDALTGISYQCSCGSTAFNSQIRSL